MVTISDVAQQCGVSVSTVSRVMNGSKKISTNTTEQVLHTIRELGYTRLRKKKLQD